MSAEYYRSPEQYLNIFYLADDPTVAAQQHCDRHVVKMILETAQLLSTAWRVLARQHPDADWVSVLDADWKAPAGQTPYGEQNWLHTTLCGQRIYRATHENHPCTKWLTLYGGNYDWLYRLGIALLDEYKYRYGKIHACTPVIRTLELVPPPLLDSMDKWCDAPAVMPSECFSGSAPESYRQYYRKVKFGILQYTRRQPPDWVADIASHRELIQ